MYKLLKSFLISIVILLAVFGIVRQVNAQWTVDGLDYTTRKQLTIDHTLIDSGLIDLPVLVKLTDANFDFDKDNDDGYDIRFTEDDGTTLLKFERERHADPNAEYWVKVGSVSSSADTDFYMYYRTTDTDNGADPTNVWDANYMMVQHISDATTSTTLDSTSNDNDGTKKGVGEPTETTSGKIGKAQDFDGDDDYIAGFSIGYSSYTTMSVWLKSDGSQTGAIAGNFSRDFWQEYGRGIIIEPDTLYAMGEQNDNKDPLSCTFDDTSWHHVVAIFSASGALYLDGVLQDSGDISSGYYDYGFAIGRCIYAGLGGSNFDGKIDEVRITDDARTAAEIKADYNSGNDSLLTYGGEETRGTLKTCSSQGGTCCSSGQTCSGGSFVNSSDCGTLCCIGGGTCQTPPQDTTPPTRSNGSPSGTLTSGATSTTMSLTTNETSTCKYSNTSNVPYATMPNTFSTTGGTSHSTTISGLTDGSSYTHYIKCQDIAGNVNSDDFLITFSVLASLSQCSQGQITSNCLCGGTEHSNGYCCSNVWQAGVCSQPEGPSITNAPSAIQQAEDITITGVNFGAHADNSPGDPSTLAVKFDDFDNGVEGEVIGNGWGNLRSSPKYSSTNQRLGSSLSTYHHFHDNIYACHFGFRDLDWDEVYITYWRRLDITYLKPPRNFKEFRIEGDISGGYPMMAYATNSGPGSVPMQNFWLAGNGHEGDDWDCGTCKNRQWDRKEFWIRIGDDPGQRFKFWENAALLENYMTPQDFPEGVGEYLGDNNSKFDYFGIGFYLRTGSEGVTQFDDIYIDTTQSRVEIGEASTFDTCTIREIQPPTAWSNNSITFTANQGSFSDGDTAYLYVVDEDGSVNEQGYQIAFGPAGPDTTPPVRSQSSPAGELAAGTTSTSLSLSTNEIAVCKYSSTSNVPYATMPNTFSTTGGTSHSTTITGLSDGNTYNYYVRCQDTSGNANTNDYLISFSVPIAPPPDTTQPSAITNLSVSNISQTSVNLNWTAPGDDGNSGTASSYDIRYSTSPVTESNWSSAIQVTGEPAPSAGGTSQSYTLTGLSSNATYYFALKTRDEVPNWSGLSNVVSAKTQSNICASFTYSNWSACQSNNTQSRTVISASPQGCIGGNPVLSQSCTYTPPTCTSFTYSNWSACQSNNTQTRTIVSQSPQGCTGGNPVLSQSCTYIPVSPVVCTSFTYSNWNECQSNNTQTRTIVSQLPQGCDGGNPVLSQSCTYTSPPCTSFTYSSWSACQPNNTQSRIVSEQSPLGCIGGNLILSQSCAYTPPGGGGGGGGGAPSPIPTPTPSPGQEITPPEEPISLMNIAELKTKIAELRAKIAELKALLIQILKQKIAEIIVKIGELKEQLDTMK